MSRNLCKACENYIFSSRITVFLEKNNIDLNSFFCTLQSSGRTIVGRQRYTKNKLLWPHKGLPSTTYLEKKKKHWEFYKVGNDKLKRSRLMRPLSSVSLDKTKRQNSIFNISVGDCLCNKFSFFLKGTLLQMKHGSVPLVVDNRHDCSRLAQWALRTKDLLLIIRRKDIHVAMLHPHS